MEMENELEMEMENGTEYTDDHPKKTKVGCFYCHGALNSV